MNTINYKCQHLLNSKLFNLCSLRNALYAFLIFNFSFLIETNATIRYVSKTGTSTPPYTTWETAADSIMEAINISEFGDTIYVANGVYEEQVVMINGLSLIGAGTDSCIIDTRALVTSQNFHSVEVTDSCLFTGFHILVYYNSTWGHGIATSGKCLVTLNKIFYGRYGISDNDSSPIIYKNTIINISQGVRLFNSNALVRKNIIYIDPNSQAAVITGIHIEAFNNNYFPIIDSNYFETYGEGIRQSFGSNPTISNNTIILKLVGARGIRGGGVPDSLKIFNNLIYAEEGFNGINPNVTNARIFNNHQAGNFNGSVLKIYSDNKVKNNVVTGGTSLGVETAIGASDFVFQYNDVWNNAANYSGMAPDSTNLSVDPMVVNDDTTQGELDFHLQKYSPLVDAGDPTMIDKDSSRIDIGLYGGLYGEVYQYIDLAPRPPINLIGEVDSGFITIKWNRNTESDFNHYKLFRDTVAGFNADSSNFVLSLTDTFYSHISPPDIDKFYYKLTAVDNQGNESEVSEELFIKLTSVNGYPFIVNNYMLYQNYPNPFNPSTKIGYRLKERGYVKLYVYSVTGELVSVLVNQTQEAGYYEVEFNVAKDSSPVLSSGVYIYQIFIKNDNNIPVYSDMRKMLLIK